MLELIDMEIRVCVYYVNSNTVKRLWAEMGDVRSLWDDHDTKEGTSISLDFWGTT